MIRGRKRSFAVPRAPLGLIICAAIALAAAGLFFAFSPNSSSAPSVFGADVFGAGVFNGSNVALNTNPLDEVAIGAADAPITIIEYASMTCNHCAAFHNEILPKLKIKYIDTGVVRMEMRPFPLDPYAMTGALLSYCVAPKQRASFIDLIFTRQHKWISAADPLVALQGLARQAGLSEEDFIICLRDEALLQNIRALQKIAVDELDVRSTPTFFINGQKVEGNRTFADFEKLLIPLVPKDEVS